MKKYNFRLIEKKWQKIWDEEKIYEPDIKNPKRPFYNLMMFPYPSAEGLHVGNMYAFTGSDIYGRFKRMQGFDVFEPIGLDGFGIHSENYALKIRTHPMKQSKISEKRFYKQLKMIGNSFSWNNKLETYNPDYYRWTQWIFVQMWKRGLAYRKKQAVNWCPSCKTVLADEQVASGNCERCETEVIKKELEQWSFRITKYADKLLENLEKIDWSEKIKVAQKNWIGKSEGALIQFPISNFQFPKNKIEKIEVFTTRPDTVFGATYLVLSPEHKIIKDLKFQISNIDEVEEYILKAKKKSEKERIENKDKTGVRLKNINAINPANDEKIPVFIADYVLSGYGTGAIMAVPAHDERDFEFAKKYKLPIKAVVFDISDLIVGNANRPNLRLHSLEKISKPYSSEIINILSKQAQIRIRQRPIIGGRGIIINSTEKFNGLTTKEAASKIIKFVKGKKETQYHLHDWLVSRQRYWGAPIPMIYCEKCATSNKGEQKDMPGWYAVPEKDLPVKLPFVEKFRPKGTGKSPLASVKKFYEVRCPSCGANAKRETDVSDTFLDSAWYHLRYPSINSSNKDKSAWDKKITKKWLPVDMYIGGAEHSVLHLLYSRFISMVLYGAELIPFEEPFTRFRAHGLLIKDGAKMSKSKGNVVNPDEYIKNFGADTFRTYLMFLAPFEQGGDFRDRGILGPSRFLERVYKLFIKNLNKNSDNNSADKEIEKQLHKTIKKVTEDIELLHYNTAISSLMILLNVLEEKNKLVSKKILSAFIKLLAPFAPHISEELWSMLGNKGSIHLSDWPKYNEKLIQENWINMVIQINGKYKAVIRCNKGISEIEAKKLAMKEKNIKRLLAETEPKRVIFIKDKLINFVI